MASSIVTAINACVLAIFVCSIYTVSAETILSSPATDLPSQNAQILEACLHLCQQGTCPSSCPQSFIGPWSKRSYHKRRLFDKSGYSTGFDDHGWFMRLLGRMN